MRQLAPMRLLVAACATPQTGSSTPPSSCRNSPIMTSVQNSRDQLMLFRRDCPGEVPTINISVLSLDSGKGCWATRVPLVERRIGR